MKLLKINWPKTFAGFPVGSIGDFPPSKSPKKQGVALIIAIMIISIMMMFASDFIVSSTVDLTLATAERDNIKAEYVAKSGANWGIWLNLFDYGIDLQFSNANDPMMKQAKAAIGPLWNKLNDVFSYNTPLDLTQIDTFAKAFGMSALMDANAIAMFQALGGELGIGVEDEGGKINLNVCYQKRSACKTIMLQLESLLSCTDVEREFLKQKDIKPAEIVAKIQDWIDQDQTVDPASGVSGEDDPYQRRVPVHKSKNSPLDTLRELRVVDGWSQEIDSYFSNYLTIYPFVHQQDKDQSAYKVNINSMSPDILKCFFSRELSSPEAKENFARKYQELLESTGGQLASSENEITTLLKDIIGFQGDPAEKGKDGDKSSWLTTKSRAFRVRAKGVVGSQTRSVEFIVERQAVVQRKGTSGTAPWRLDGYTMH